MSYILTSGSAAFGADDSLLGDPALGSVAEFLWLLLLVALAAAAVVVCVMLVKARRLRRLTDPTEDHVHKARRRP